MFHVEAQENNTYEKQVENLDLRIKQVYNILDKKIQQVHSEIGEFFDETEQHKKQIRELLKKIEDLELSIRLLSQKLDQNQGTTANGRKDNKANTLQENDAKNSYENTFQKIQQANVNNNFSELTKLSSQYRSRFKNTPYDEKIFYYLSYSTYKLGNYSKASVRFLNFLERYPKSENLYDAQWYLGNSMEKLGNKEGAVKVYTVLSKTQNNFSQQARRKLNLLR